jgi:hypothetical protein
MTADDPYETSLDDFDLNHFRMLFSGIAGSKVVLAGIPARRVS